MRTFVQGTGHERKFVLIEVNGRSVAVTHGNSDGVSKRSEKDLGTDAAAASASQQLAKELAARGFVEQTAKGTMKTASSPKAQSSSTSSSGAMKASSSKVQAPPRPTPPTNGAKRSRPDDLFAVAAEAEDSAPVLPRAGRLSGSNLAATPPRAVRDEPAAKSPKKKKKKKRKDPGEKKDWVTLGGLGLVAAIIVGVTGHFLWTAFLKPTSIVGSWQGSRVEKDLGGPISYANYKLILDDQGRAALTVLDGTPMIGTYKVEGDRLKLNLAESEDGESVEFKFKLSTVTLDLFEPSGGRKIVELVRKFEMEPVPRPAKKKVAPKRDALEPDDEADAPPGEMEGDEPPGEMEAEGNPLDDGE